MQDKNNIYLVASEVAGLWNSYTSDSLIVCMLRHFSNNVEDEKVRPILQQGIDLSTQHMGEVVNFFNREGLPIPQGYGDKDVDMNAPRLYTDTFYLFYLINMAQSSMNIYTLVLNHIARPDIRDFFSRRIKESVDLFNRIAKTLLSQGLYIKAPRVEFLKEVEFIKKQEFLSGFLGRKRTMTGNEITQIFATLRSNIIGAALLTGFGQVAKSKKISDYAFRGKDISVKKIETITSVLTSENIPIPSTSDSFVTDSTTAPFSDKLMMNHIALLISASISQDGMSLANVLRHDLHAYYMGSITEIAKYAEDGIDILVENQWLEQPPQAIAHENLVKA